MFESLYLNIDYNIYKKRDTVVRGKGERGKEFSIRKCIYNVNVLTV